MVIGSGVPIAVPANARQILQATIASFLVETTRVMTSITAGSISQVRCAPLSFGSAAGRPPAAGSERIWSTS